MVAAFPIPRSLPRTSLGLSVQAARLLMQDGELRPPKHINTPRAFRFARATRFGTHFESELHENAWRKIQPRFFWNVNFHRKDGELTPIEVGLRKDGPFTDGDTARVKRFWNGTRWITFQKHWSVRMDGIDTPESKPSQKLNEIVYNLWRYLRSEHNITNAQAGQVKALIKARVVYLGDIAGAVTNAFGKEFAQIGLSLAPAYTRVASRVDMCDTLDLSDKYGRLIGRIMAGKPNHGEDLIAGFIEAALPAYMAQARDEIREDYEAMVEPHRELLAQWKTSRPELYAILAPESVPDLLEIFSEAECERFGRVWRTFTKVKKNQGGKNDLQTMLAFLGLAYPYEKYRGHKTDLDLRAETYALGTAPRVKGRRGLTTDTIYMLMRPSVDSSDPFRSPMWVRYYDKDKPLHPKDCCDVFGCTG